MLRVSLFLLLSLALHAAGWLLHGTHPRSPAAMPVSEAPQVLRLSAVLQSVAPAPVPSEPVQLQSLPKPQPAVATKPPVAARPLVTPKPRNPEPVVSPPKPSAPPTVSAPAQAAPAAAKVVAAAAVEREPAKPAAPSAPVEVLSSQPSFLEPPRQPSYPSQARRRNQQGVVLVEVRLDARGQQRSVNVLRSSGVDSLDRAALEAVAKWRFLPETTGGQAVPSRVQIPIQFALTASR
ncbi:energy transducer TonB [Pseudomonas sp. Ga0074129]|uniref:energy transducer TonB n=1 Tax=Pseudomonas sp. Ga0074129 TaxID=1752219 RepID=UPI000B1EFFC3|nr:energy transducer TonB [Pseudomonas sp. Ga0074129]